MKNQRPLGLAKAKGNVVALTLDRDKFIRVLGNNWGSLITKTIDKRKLVSTMMTVSFALLNDMLQLCIYLVSY